MPTLIATPNRIPTPRNTPILIAEHISQGRSGHRQLTIAFLQSPPASLAPGQTADSEESTVVLKGMRRGAPRDGVVDVRAGQAIITPPSEWVQYSTTESEGAEYAAVCLPAYSMETAHRDS